MHARFSWVGEVYTSVGFSGCFCLETKSEGVLIILRAVLKPYWK